MKKSNKIWIFPLLLAGFILMFTNSCETKTNPDDTEIPIDSTNNSNLTIPSGWSKVGDINANNMIWSITSDASGNVYAGGYFTNAGGFHYVARWDGAKWSDIGIKANSSIYALTTDAANNIYAVGDFSNGVTSNGGNHYVAKWNGTVWSDIGQSHSDLLLTADATGNIYNGTSKWDGSAWSNFGILNSDKYGSKLALATNPSGNTQYTGGDFAHTSGYRYVAKWNGTAWTEVGSLNANASIQYIVADNSGNIYAAGSFTNGILPSTGYHYVAKWDGTLWKELGNLNANGQIYSLAVDNSTGYVYASGYFTNSEGKAYVAKWNGTAWSDLGDMALSPTPIYVSSTGKLYSVVAGHDGKIYCIVVHN
jgi:hypothetical protein